MEDYSPYGVGVVHSGSPSVAVIIAGCPDIHVIHSSFADTAHE